jgi:hypothetical protein
MPVNVAYEEVKKACIADIAEHLAERGAQDWENLRARYVPESMSDRTFWRLVEAVKAGKPHTEILAGKIKKAKITMMKAGDHLPAPISPEYLVKGGSDAIAKVDFLAEFTRLWRDIRLLREWSTTPGEDGKEKIKNPQFFVQQIRLSRETMETAMKVASEVYKLNTSQEMWRAVLDEVEKESPECAERIIKRIARLNAERGLTIHADIGGASDDD